MGVYVPPGFLGREGTLSVSLVLERQADVTRIVPTGTHSSSKYMGEVTVVLRKVRAPAPIYTFG